MKTEHLKSRILQNRQRDGVALPFFVSLFLLVLTSGAAQLRDQKHVTAIQLGGAAEGSRVTVVSDSPLVDYEAFRRGDRFYVKIPLADFGSASPHFRADGFEDVQVQKVGSSLIVSFKLQAGATARVDQRGNHLDVIFYAPNRSSYNKTMSAGSTQGSQSTVDRRRDAAGPMPSDSVPASRGRVVTDRAGSVNGSRASGDPRWRPRSKGEANNNSSKTGNNQSTTALNPTTGVIDGYRNVPVASPSPFASPASILSPGNSTSYTPLTSNTPPPTSVSSSPAASSSALSDSLNWRNRASAARRWMSTNRLATLLGALILLSLIVYLATAIRRRQKNVGKTRRTKAPKVQPKYSPDSELNELPNAGLTEQATRRDTGARSAASSRSMAAPDHDRPRILPRPAIVPPTAGHEEHSDEEEEREVFEL